MVVGLLTLELFFPDSHSLKGKRSLVRPIIERLRRNWNVSVAEVEHQDTWQRANLAVASVNTDGAEVQRTLNEVVRQVEAQHSLHLLDYSIQIL